jgi:hypothetical protein
MSHKHGWPYEDPDDQKCTDLGPTVCIRSTIHGDDEHLAGFIIAYEWEDEPERLEGAVTVDTCGAFKDSALWEMTGTLEGGDLTLKPSVQAYKYVPGRPPRDVPTIHGYVTAGEWVQA